MDNGFGLALKIWLKLELWFKKSDLSTFRDFRDLADICCTLADVQQRLGIHQRSQKLDMIFFLIHAILKHNQRTIDDP